MVLHKDDIENPIFRVEMIIEKTSPRQLFEVLRDHAQVSQWFGKNLQSKLLQAIPVVPGEPADKVYASLHKGGAQPLKNREIVHRHIMQADESRHLYVVSFSTQGLE